MDELRLIDTFAGIGGFRLAAEAAAKEAGLKPRCVLSVEIDKSARKTYAANFGDEPREDMTKIPAVEFPEHDLLLGGPPCQPFSKNGKWYNKHDKTLGDDDRKNLFFRLMDVLQAKRPKFFVFENVKEIRTIRNMDGESLYYETLMENLRGCGYDVQCEVLDSKDFGLPQQRRRAYFVGTRSDLGLKYSYPEKVELAKCVGDILEDPAKVSGDYLLSRLWKRRKYGVRENDGVPHDVDKIIEEMEAKGKEGKTLEVELSPEASFNPEFATLLKKRWAKAKAAGKTCLTRFDVLRIATKCGAWKKPDGKVKEIWPLGIIYGDTPSLLPRQQDKLYSALGVSPTIATFSTPSFDAPGGWRVLTPRECARLQGFPDTFGLHKDDGVAYHQVGNAVSVSVARAVILSLLKAAKGEVPDGQIDFPKD